MVLRDFQIEVFSLAPGTYSFPVKAGEDYFKKFENPELENANIEACIVIEKMNLTQSAKVSIDARVPILCNRCNACFLYSFKKEISVVIKKGDPLDSTDEVLFADESDEGVDFSQLIYDSVVTEIPGRFVPCMENPSFPCNKNILNKLKKIESDTATNSENDTSIALGDSHADILKKLYNHFKN
jgi:hypothetical protein